MSSGVEWQCLEDGLQNWLAWSGEWDLWAPRKNWNCWGRQWYVVLISGQETSQSNSLVACAALEHTVMTAGPSGIRHHYHSCKGALLVVLLPHTEGRGQPIPGNQIENPAAVRGHCVICWRTDILLVGWPSHTRVLALHLVLRAWGILISLGLIDPKSCLKTTNKYTESNCKPCLRS